jgi:N-methylhydantoinase A
VNENMAAALKQVSLDRGRDPRDFCLVAFGGAGPMHAVSLAKIMGINEVIIPSESGVFSAYGAVAMDFKNDFEKTFYCPFSHIDLNALNEQYRMLDQEGRRILKQQGIVNGKTRTVRSAQIRYIGQTYEVETAVPNGVLGPRELEDILSNFHRQHEKEYGFSEKTFPSAFVNLKSTMIGSVSKPDFKISDRRDESIEQAQKGIREVFFEEAGFLAATVLDRRLLAPGHKISGPAILDDQTSTTILGPDMAGEVDHFGNILIRIHE